MIMVAIAITLPERSAACFACKQAWLPAPTARGLAVSYGCDRLAQVMHWFTLAAIGWMFP
ncbi:hypothetical protein [Marinobacter sp.]|uniref:hypothetical protein n=1 Tax=Marinobacter sp. TaxID=50741 RepID=UPI001B3FDB6E|nr:hypothetical protein [Marinobacter sp.]MBQ0832303.1 hypothetical protein [Marinobacter sp.]